MKTVMTKVSPLLLFAAILSFSGCYTELATKEYEEPYYATDSDTTYTEEEIIVNNHYYLDDDYRRSRFRLSFNYYSPTYHSSWIGSYYSSYYDDYYWGLNRPWWWYHYPGYVILYPTPWWPPIYDPWYPYPYYPPVAYYPTYYPYPSYPNTPGGNPGRIRDNGATRDNTNPGERSRPVGGVGTIPGTEVANGIRVREPLPDAVTVKERPANDIPWWERQKEERKRTETDDRTAGRPTIRQKQPQRTDAGSNQPRKEGTRTQTRPAERKTRSVPESATPAQRNKEEKKSVTPQRSRQEQRSYSPPPSRQAPASSVPRSGNSGSSSTSSGGRKRTD
ncbi:MAG: hypothetical protein ACYC09_03530 [Bacteroidota bacterium]